MMHNRRGSLGGRMLCSAALLALLAACSYVGSQEPDVQAASVPVTRVMISGQEISESAVNDTRIRLRQAREQEIALLDTVLGDAYADTEMRRNALEQKTALAHRMEQEAQLEAAFSYMGLGSLAVMFGAGAITVFVPAETALDESERVRIIDAAASQTGLSPGDVKIILAKK